MPEGAAPKPKPTAEEVRARRAEQLAMFRLRVLIDQELDARGITTSVGMADALGLAPGEAMGLLSRKQRREGDLEALRVAAARLGIPDAQG